MIDFASLLAGLGGLLGTGSTPNPAMPPAGPEFYSEAAAAGQATNIPKPPALAAFDPFARFTEDQRRQLGLGYAADAMTQLGGRQGNAVNSLMGVFDGQAGRSAPKIPNMMQPEERMQIIPIIQTPSMGRMQPTPGRGGSRLYSLLGM
jgi:hypothetical protein